ncbi:MAG: iron ABC transporter permease [Eggerthellaceae bacterium]|nr:iron ABC transporter permease [Eggerthellaceae bacterium]
MTEVRGESVAAQEERIIEEHLAQEAERALNRKLSPWVKLGIVAAFVVVFFGSFMLGRYPVMPVEWFQGVIAHFVHLIDSSAPIDGTLENVLFKIRFPRICVVLLVGAALAVAGASYQGMFKNPLVSPDILGASAGASFGACLALLLDLPNAYVQLFAFCGGMLAVGLAVWLNKLVRYDPILGLVLGGILVSTLFQSGTSVVKLLADANDKLPSITFWLMGSFASEDADQLAVIILPMLGGFALLLLESWKLNVLSFGDEEARSMGINTRLVRLVVIFASTLVVSCSVAVSGIVGWVGLVVPHVARAVVGPNYRVLLPASMIIGSTFLLIVDDIARLMLSVEIPIGILTAIMGVPFFVIIFRHNMKGWK